MTIFYFQVFPILSLACQRDLYLTSKISVMTHAQPLALQYCYVSYNSSSPYAKKQMHVRELAAFCRSMQVGPVLQITQE